MSAMRRPGAHHRSGGPGGRPPDHDEDLPHEWWDQVEEDIRAYTSEGGRAGRTAERQP